MKLHLTPCFLPFQSLGVSLICTSSARYCILQTSVICRCTAVALQATPTMQYGPVPSNVDDILKAVRGDSFFSGYVDELKDKLAFENRYIVKELAEPDMDELSESDVECLTYAIDLCHDKSFGQLTDLSHGMAWTNTARDRAISVKDILREAGDEEEYVEYIADQFRLQSALLQ